MNCKRKEGRVNIYSVKCRGRIYSRENGVIACAEAKAPRRKSGQVHCNRIIAVQRQPADSVEDILWQALSARRLLVGNADYSVYDCHLGAVGHDYLRD